MEPTIQCPSDSFSKVSLGYWVGYVVDRVEHRSEKAALDSVNDLVSVYCVFEQASEQWLPRQPSGSAVGYDCQKRLSTSLTLVLKYSRIVRIPRSKHAHGHHECHKRMVVPSIQFFEEGGDMQDRPHWVNSVEKYPQQFAHEVYRNCELSASSGPSTHWLPTRLPRGGHSTAVVSSRVQESTPSPLTRYSRLLQPVVPSCHRRAYSAATANQARAGSSAVRMSYLLLAGVWLPYQLGRPYCSTHRRGKPEVEPAWCERPYDDV